MRVICICLMWCLALAALPYSKALTKPACPAIKLRNGRARYRHKSGFVQNTCDTGYVLAGDKYMKCQKGVWEGVTPYCVRGTCEGQMREPVNGFVFPSHNGGVLTFFCKPGYELVGASTAFCDGNAWSTHLPICTQSNKTMSVSCNFETEDICGWTHDLNHNFDWVRHSRFTPSSFLGTGPSHDHTFGRGPVGGLAGHYMYIESSAKNPNDKARLISPTYPAQVNRTCLSFWYHMYGSSTGDLNVYIRRVSRRDWSFVAARAVWSRSGNHNDRWLEGFVDLGPVDEDFQVIFEGVRGGSYKSDTAIDDVNLIENCDEREMDVTTTTEETSSDDGQLYFERWSCYNRCGANLDGSLCSCLPDCYEHQSCCPDYEAYCLDVDSSTSTESSSIWWSEDSTMASTIISWTHDALEWSATEESDIMELPTSPEQPDEEHIATEYIKPIPTTTTILPRTSILPTTTPPKIIPLPVPPPRVNPKKISPPITFRTPKPRVPIVIPQKTRVIPKDIFKQDENQVLRDKPTVQEISRQEVATNKDLKTNTGFFSPSTILIMVGVVSTVVFILVVVKMRRRVVSACDSMRMRRSGGACDSQSDVRFLTSDEVLDFSIASSSL